MNLKIYEDSKNYTCQIVEIKNLIPIEGMNKIQLTNIFGNTIIVSTDTKIGDIGLFFPSECVISPDFLKNNNLFKHSELNVDQTQKGYFENSGRVKSLRMVKGTVISTGFYISLKSLDYLGKLDLQVGDEFSEINGNFICRKYIPKAIQNAVARSKNDKLAHRFAKLIPDQFRLHGDTSKLAMNLHRLRPEDIIVISGKIHGTSAVFAHVLVNRDLRWYEKLAKFFGVGVIKEEYAHIVSSRTVIKTVDINNGDQQHFYDQDIWTHTGMRLEDFIERGITLYGEIVGYLDSGKAIQSMSGKAYDYGCADRQSEFYVYRITYTTPQGKVIEFSWQQIKDYCERYNLNHVPEYYFGSLRDFYFRFVNPQDEEISENFADEIFTYLQTAYNMERQCEFCFNDVPAEGLVVRRDGKQDYEAYKLKSKTFLLRESEALDSETDVDLESLES